MTDDRAEFAQAARDKAIAMGADPEIQRVDHVGMWRLYKRTRGKR